MHIKKQYDILSVELLVCGSNAESHTNIIAVAGPHERLNALH